MENWCKCCSKRVEDVWRIGAGAAPKGWKMYGELVQVLLQKGGRCMENWCKCCCRRVEDVWRIGASAAAEGWKIYGELVQVLLPKGEKTCESKCVGSARTIYIYTVYVRHFWLGNHQITRPYTVYMYDSGQPYKCVLR